VHLSKPNIAGEAISFFPELVRPVISAGGPVLALARQDGRLFAFKERHTLYAVGDGPDATGASDNLSDFETLSLEVGAVDQRHVLRTDLGVFARGNKGFWLIGRDMQPQPIGADVETYNSTTLLDCCSLADKDEVRFLLSGGTELVFNTFYRTWSSNPTIYATCIAAVDGVRYFHADTTLGGGTVNAGIYYESGYADEHRTNTTFALKLVVGWLKFAGLQGFQRIYELLFLADSDASDTTSVYLYFDYVDTLVETHTITSANATSAGTTAYQFAVKPARQKCESVKVRIENSSPTGSFSLSSLAALVGIKPGSFKMPSTKEV
jgi:hypothetical protein